MKKFMLTDNFSLKIVVLALTVAFYGCSSSSDDDDSGSQGVADTPVEEGSEVDAETGAPADSETDADADAPVDSETDESSADGTSPEDAVDAPAATDNGMDFFLTSVGPGDGANLGGLGGADAHCAILADSAGSTGREWRAYLSTTGDGGVNAIDRIGQGPWTNANGVVVAESPENLVSDENNLNQETSITETGAVVNGVGDSPNMHDILTGTELDGTASSAAGDTTCGNWTSNGDGSATVGHHDRVGGGANATSWSSAHPSAGCSQANLEATGGSGLFYCFAIN